MLHSMFVAFVCVLTGLECLDVALTENSKANSKHRRANSNNSEANMSNSTATANGDGCEATVMLTCAGLVWRAAEENIMWET